MTPNTGNGFGLRALWFKRGLWILWLIILAGGFWLYQQSRFSSSLLQDVDVRNAVMKLGSRITASQPEASQSGHLKIIHFLDPACPCTAFTLTHLQSLKALLSELQAEQWLITPGSTESTAKIAQAIGATPIPETFPLNVGPAIAIWSPEGDLAYFGPYSLSMICGEDELLNRVLKASALSQWTEAPYSIETGCFCAWTRA